jgi:tetratricopeptide (TPR) repeat protein
MGLLVVSTGCTLTVDNEKVVELKLEDIFKPQKQKDQEQAQAESDEMTRLYKMNKSDLAIWQSPEFREEMVHSYLAVSDVEPRIPQSQKEKHQEVLNLLREDKRKEAIELLQRVRGPGSSAVFDYLLGNIYFQMEKIDQAAEAYETAIDQFPNYRNAIRNLSLIYFQMGDHPKAMKNFLKVIELGGGDANIYGMLGYSYADQQKWLSAESALRMAMLLSPDQAEWKAGLAASLRRQKRYAESVALYDQLILEQPGKAELWIDQAYAYLGQDQRTRAAENFEFIDAMGKADMPMLTTLGDISVQENLYPQATDAYIRAMAKDPVAQAQTPEAAEKALEQRKKNTERIARAAQVMASRAAIDPNALQASEELVEHLHEQRSEDLDKETRLSLLRVQARIAMARHASQDQVEIVREIVRLDPLDAGAMMLLARHAVQNDQPEQAAIWYERAARVKGFGSKAKMRHAELLISQKDYQRALEKYEEALEIMKENDEDTRRVEDRIEDIRRYAGVR